MVMLSGTSTLGACVLRRGTLGVSLLLLALPPCSADPVVKSVTATQRPGTRIADIEYEVLDPGDGAMAVEFSGYDHENERTVPVTALNGETGSGFRGELVESGPHSLVWDLVADWGGNLSRSSFGSRTAKWSRRWAPRR
jgi:hypothetical protein